MRYKNISVATLENSLANSCTTEGTARNSRCARHPSAKFGKVDIAYPLGTLWIEMEASRSRITRGKHRKARGNASIRRTV